MEERNRGRKRKTELRKERRQNYDESEKIEKKKSANELQQIRRLKTKKRNEGASH